jgi:hypothetical protein
MSSVSSIQSGTCSAPVSSRPVDAKPQSVQSEQVAKPKTDTVQVSEEAKARLAADQQQQQKSQVQDLDDSVKLKTANQALVAMGI